MLRVEITVEFPIVSKFGLLYRFSRRSLISGGEGVPAIPGYDGYDRSWSCYLSDSKSRVTSFLRPLHLVFYITLWGSSVVNSIP